MWLRFLRRPSLQNLGENTFLCFFFFSFVKGWFHFPVKSNACYRLALLPETNFEDIVHQTFFKVLHNSTATLVSDKQIMCGVKFHTHNVHMWPQCALLYCPQIRENMKWGSFLPSKNICLLQALTSRVRARVWLMACLCDSFQRFVCLLEHIYMRTNSVMFKLFEGPPLGANVKLGMFVIKNYGVPTHSWVFVYASTAFVSHYDERRAAYINDQRVCLPPW